MVYIFIETYISSKKTITKKIRYIMLNYYYYHTCSTDIQKNITTRGNAKK